MFQCQLPLCGRGVCLHRVCGGHRALLLSHHTAGQITGGSQLGKLLTNIVQFVTTLPRTHYLGVDVSKGLTISHMASHPNNAQYPDASSVSYDEQNARVTVVYNDHSLYIWDVKDIRKVIINISQEEASVSWRHSRVIGFHSMESQRSAKRAAICNTRLRVRKKCNCYIQLTTQSTRTKADRNDQAILLFTVFTDFRNTAVLYALLWNISLTAVGNSIINWMGFSSEC